MDLNAARINRLKWTFMEVAAMRCPGFTITPELRSAVNDLFRWATLLPGPLDLDKGLWLWGDIGTGKTTMLQILREYCAAVRPCTQERGLSVPAIYWFEMVRADELCHAYAKEGYTSLRRYVESGRLAIDDVGQENRQVNHYGTPENVVQHILQGRYAARGYGFTHVTSNLSPEQIADAYGERVYDRCLQMFNFVEFRGYSFR